MANENNNRLPAVKSLAALIEDLYKINTPFLSLFENALFTLEGFIPSNDDECAIKTTLRKAWGSATEHLLQYGILIGDLKLYGEKEFLAMHVANQTDKDHA